MFTMKRLIADAVARWFGTTTLWIIENIGPDLLVFGSDYPHPEGTSDPIARFEASMPDCDEETLDRFYYRNMEDLLGIML